MEGKVALFPLSQQKTVIRLIVVILIFLATSIALTLLVYTSGSLIFPDWNETREFLNSGEIELANPVILRYLQIGQDLSLFIIPSLIISYSIYLDFTTYTGLRKRPSLTSLFLVAALLLFLMVLNTFLGWLNSGMHLPDSMGGIEEWMKLKEHIAEKFTVALTASSASPSLFVNIVVVALLPAIAEELFFRGVIQNLMTGIFRNGNLAVWITALFFSAIHMQFYGFIPRLVLGLVFGYLFLWSGTVWLPVFAHLLNNSVPVFIAWYYGWREGTIVTENFVRENLFTVAMSLLAIISIMYLIKKDLKWKGKISPSP